MTENRPSERAAGPEARRPRSGPGRNAWSVPSRFGEYRLLRRLGGGGSAEVFLAEHEKLGRQVALKLVHPGSVHFPEARERLLHEARAASRLDHPGICPVFDIGTVGDVPFLAMRHIEGETLARWIAEARRSNGLPPGGPRSRPAVLQLAALAEKVARTLHAAHEAGLIHRDIKPGNIMVAAGGEPVVLDFGLAQLEGAPAGADDRFGWIVGTPDYVPPEQVAGPGAPPTPQWDIYSLGVLLYEALALRTPFQAPTLEQLQANILSGEYMPLRRLNRSVPRDLETVVATALAREPGRRYRSALELAEDLRRVRQFEPILVRAPGPFVKARRWGQRNPLPAAFGALLLLALAGALFLLQRVDHLHRRNQELLTRTRAHGLASASAGLFASNQKLALLLAEAAARTAPLPVALTQLSRVLGDLQELASFEPEGELNRGAALSPRGDLVLTWSYVGGGCLWDSSGRLLERFQVPGHQIVWMRFSPDQSLVLACMTGGRAVLWDLEGEEIAALEGHRAYVSQALFSPSGSRILTLSTDLTARIWERSGECRATLGPHEKPISCAAFSPDGEQIATGEGNGMLRLWGPRGDLLWAVPAHAGRLRSLDWSPSGERIATAGADRLARLWDREGRPLASCQGHEGEVISVRFAPDGEELLTAAQDLTARLWSLEGACRRILQGPRKRILETEYSPGGEWILLASQDEPVRLFDRQGRLAQSFSGHLGLITAANFSSDGERLLVASREGGARLWSLVRRAVPSIPCRRSPYMAAALSPSGERFLTLDGSRVRIWDGSGHPHAVLELPDSAHWAEFSPDGKTIATCGRGQDARLWSAEGSLVAVLSDGEQSLRRVLFSPDGERIVTIGVLGPTALWNREGRLVARWEGPLPGSAGLLFSPDGSQVLWADKKYRVFLSDPAGRNPLPVEPDLASAPHLAWSPDGRHLAAASRGGRIRLWDRKGRLQADFQVDSLSRGQLAFAEGGASLLLGLQTGSLALYSLQGIRLCEMPLQQGAITSLSLARDGVLVLSASQDGTACLSRLPCQELLSLDGHEGAVTTVLLFPDGTRALTSGEDGVARLWPLEPEALRELARLRAGRSFSPSESHRFADLLGSEAGR